MKKHTVEIDWLVLMLLIIFWIPGSYLVYQSVGWGGLAGVILIAVGASIRSSKF